VGGKGGKNQGGFSLHKVPYQEADISIDVNERIQRYVSLAAMPSGFIPDQDRIVKLLYISHN